MTKTYQTEQRKLLIDFLSRNSGKQLTVDEIAAQFPAGKSTLYRLIGKLTKEGLVRKSANENSRKFFYEFLGADSCHAHFHLKCSDCGKLIHLESDISAKLHTNLLNSYNFEADAFKTTIVGKCENCVISAEAKL